MRALVPRLLCGLLVLTVEVSGQTNREPNGAPRNAGRVLERISIIDPAERIPYLVFVPSSYDPVGGERPLIVAFHGTAGRPQQILEIPRLMELADRYGYLVACPASSGWYGRTFFLGRPTALTERSDRHVMDVLARTREEFRVDDERTYLLGVSLGGAGVWHLALRRPELWAGIAPISPARYAGTRDLEPIAQVPVIMVQGEQDTAVSVSGNRRLAAAMQRLGMRYRYLEIPAAGHDLSGFDIMSPIFEFFSATERRLP